MTLCLLLLFSMLVTLSAGALYYVSRTASEAYLYQQGLSSVYAAESGANVALGRLKTGTTSGKEEYALTCEEGPLFVKNGERPLAISFSILHRSSGEMMDFRTSLLSYADFYRKGQRYE